MKNHLKNMIPEKIKNRFALIIDNIDLAFVRAFDDIVGKKARGLLILILVVLVLLNLSFGATLNWLLFFVFFFYGWENRILAGGAGVYLIFCIILLLFEKNALANTMAEQAYLLLLMAVILQIKEFNQESIVNLQKKIVRTYIFNKIISFLARVEKEGRKLFQIFNKAGFKIDKNVLILFSIIIIIFWKILLPGYLLTMDMTFAPDMRVILNSSEKFLNFVLVSYLIHLLDLFAPAWVVQKIMLIGLFFSIGWLAFKYLLAEKNNLVRWFTALIYLVNPFVYTRFLAGQWLVLWGYAFLPPLLYWLFLFQEKKDRKSALHLFGWLFLIGVFSNHFFFMSAFLLAVWFSVFSIKNLIKKKYFIAWKMWKNILLGGAMFLVLSSYWLVPALLRKAPLEQRFGAAHWEYFSAGGYKKVSPILNLVSLNGFWGERNVWAKSFLFPQDYETFWIAFLLLAGLIIIGVFGGLLKKEKRLKTIIFLIIGFCALVFSAGIGDTIFRSLNFWFFENVPLWSGFRDSQKFSGFLALIYAVFAGLGFSALLDFFERRKFIFRDLIIPLLFLVPFFFGSLMWGGFHQQLSPVWYPQSWFDSKKIIEADTSMKKILILPWHGYMSFKFNDNLVIGNPARRFFGEKAIVSRSVEIGNVYDQENEAEYREIDQAVTDNSSENDVLSFLLSKDIKYVVFFQDLKSVDKLKYTFLKSEKVKIVLKSKEVILYKIGD